MRLAEPWGWTDLDQRHTLAGDDVRHSHRTGRKLRKIDAEPFGQGGVQINNLTLATCGKETGRRVVEIIDGVLQFAEEAFLIFPLRRDIGNLEDVQRLAARILQHPTFQSVPVRPAGSGLPERLEQTELLVTVTPLPQNIDEAIERLGRFPAAREQRLQALDIARLRGAAHPAIGGVGVDHMPLGIGNQCAVRVCRQETAGQPVRLRLRHDLDETDDRRHQKKDTHHR